MADFKDKKQQIQELLKLHYGFESFRPGQEQAIDNILNKKSSIIIMPTGGGKSLIFQLPALVLDGVTLVISPLISLMKDQVDSLNEIGIPATFITTDQSISFLLTKVDKCAKGSSTIVSMLFIYPIILNIEISFIWHCPRSVRP